ncbi:Glucose-repressible protein [Exophiala mesophila]|uniref:Glucose-repressible protein n=1 Tax=Exophiala mesophila TaxID=212818 RepID=A0A438N3J0_EXOME|nr:Glucose-repressible protein [Exophiala mesophila]
MDTIKNAANYVSETIQGGGATASKEANKEVAKDGNANLSTRAQAAGDAISDKVDEQTHNRKADVHKEAAKH